MTSDQDKDIFECYLALEKALRVAGLPFYASVADAIASSTPTFNARSPLSIASR